MNKAINLYNKIFRDHIYNFYYNIVFSLVQSLKSYPTLCDRMDCSIQAFLSFTNSQSLVKFMSFKLVMPSNHLILCHPLLFLPSIFPSIRVFSSESVLRIKGPKYWNFSFSISPSNEYSELISLGMSTLISVLSKGLSRVFSNNTIQKHQFFSAQLSL